MMIGDDEAKNFYKQKRHLPTEVLYRRDVAYRISWGMELGWVVSLYCNCKCTYRIPTYTMGSE